MKWTKEKFDAALKEASDMGVIVGPAQKYRASERMIGLFRKAKIIPLKLVKKQ